MKLFTVKDSVANTFTPPFCMLTERDAIAGFTAVTNDSESQYSKHPKDFTLCCVGAFDSRSGLIVTEEPRELAIASDLIASK